MDEQAAVGMVLAEYGLEDVLRGYEVFERHATLNLQGIVSLSRLEETPALARVLDDLGMPVDEVRGLYARVTAQGVQAHTVDVQRVVEEAVTRAAQEVWALLTLQPGAGAVVYDEMHHHLWATVEPIDLRTLSRSERLDRARALTGRVVADTHEVRAAEAAQRMQEHALLHFPPPLETGTQEEPSDDDLRGAAQHEAIMRAEGTLYPDERD